MDFGVATKQGTGRRPRWLLHEGSGIHEDKKRTEVDTMSTQGGLGLG